MLKFTELTPEAKKTAVEGFIEDAKAFDFGWDGMDEDNVAELLASKLETHRYDSNGVVVGIARYYGERTVFSAGGMY
ncbi:hypothetical protein D1B31_18345 [Neobacillus notoginsengisoli]|uniref:GNAT family N-acetyltransferase n=1 Tax=Neobacillus notoginsengisoli TaxID=1578198 RepID=A0A417YPW9_9BACI|nr:hypothetical protein [Neobacillus notoginsengisoli]RHW36044.1 hypothetical protein D1B31_18345 [Neobacillus notoginsengisoli]